MLTLIVGFNAFKYEVSLRKIISVVVLASGDLQTPRGPSMSRQASSDSTPARGPHKCLAALTDLPVPDVEDFVLRWLMSEDKQFSY